MKNSLPLIAGLAFGSILSPASAEIIDCEFEHGVTVEVQYQIDSKYSSLDNEAVARVSPYPSLWTEPVNRKGQFSALNSAGAEVFHEDFDFYAYDPDLADDERVQLVDVWMNADEVSGKHTLVMTKVVKQYQESYGDGGTLFNTTHWRFEAEGKCLPRAE